MDQSKALDKICKEYLSKCSHYGCDSCVAECFCIINGLRTDRYPQDDCVDKLKEYLKSI